MKAEYLIELLADRPFIPIRLHLSNGRIHEIRHPEMVIVSDQIVAIGLPRDDGSKLAARITHCSTAHIVEAEPVAAVE